MPNLSQLTLTDFRNGLKDSSVAISQKIHLFLGGTTALFMIALSVIYLTTMPGPPEGESRQFISIMTGAHFLFAIAAIMYGKVASDRSIKNGAQREYSSETRPSTLSSSFSDPAESCVGSIRTAMILRMASMEGASFFGMAVVLLAIRSNLIYSEPVYFINALTPIVFVFYVVMTFPTRERFEKVFQDHIQAHS